MSTHYYIECATCAVSSDDLGNRVDKQVKALAAEWPAIKAALELFARLSGAPGYIDIQLDLTRPNGYHFTSFMRDHADHQLLLESEHGDKEPLLVGGAPELNIKVVACAALPDGMWAFVKDGKVVASNFEPKGES